MTPTGTTRLEWSPGRSIFSAPAFFHAHHVRLVAFSSSLAVNRVVSLTSVLLTGGTLLLTATAGERSQRGEPVPTATEPAPAPSSSCLNHVIVDLGIELLWIKPGTFTMGSPLDEPGRNKAEGPQNRVTLTHGFWLGRTEVTQAQYETVTGMNPSRFKDAGKFAPVEEVSWLDAIEF